MELVSYVQCTILQIILVIEIRDVKRGLAILEAFVKTHEYMPTWRMRRYVT